MAAVDTYLRIGSRFYIPGLTAQKRDQILVTIWFLATFKQFPMDELVLYPLALYFACAFARDIDALFPVLKRGGWMLFPFPIWCTLSVLWGLEAGLIVKSSLQLYLTVLISFCAALRLEQRQLVFSFMIAAGVFAVLSRFAAPGPPERGIFGSKNQMGLNMVMLWLAALCVLFDPGQRRAFRILALVLAALSLNLVFIAQSATAVLLAFGLLGLVGFILLLRGRGLLHPQVMLTLSLGLGVLIFGGALFLSTSSVDVAGIILEKFGKDATLTGRTVLWGYAFDQIRENPLLGVGHGGFWRPYDWTSLARKIYVDFHMALSARFYFHNAYLEVAVHQGLIGLAFALLAFGFGVWQTTVALLRRIDMPQAFFFSIAAMMLVRNMTEPGLMTAFAQMTMILYMGALMEARDRAGIDPGAV
ncbi:O-antigen ligase family protein [Celeribacter indicus]|uniref:O-antigen polymerase n=1 Tax=Celeribacter indicus TaxID=1208324 RepID=A0A0B5DWK7_9RHOB|nr:O-antigen ligase family protein [Celeribacter indicus]AJE47798.1 O-antigen polymerase [Celeribacter indicus]SDW23239.1 O-antigen ligase [Celeribacter indicus]